MEMKVQEIGLGGGDALAQRGLDVLDVVGAPGADEIDDQVDAGYGGLTLRFGAIVAHAESGDLCPCTSLVATPTTRRIDPLRDSSTAR